MRENAFVQAYVAELEHELRDAPAQQRQELLEQVRAEYETRLATTPNPTDRQILAVSAALGKPRTLAQQSGLVPRKQPSPGTTRDQRLGQAALIGSLAALILTFYSSVAAIVVGAVAVVLIAVSIRKWQLVKKLLVVAIMATVATVLILLVQTLGASQGG